MSLTPITTKHLLNILVENHKTGRRGPVVQITQECEDSLDSYFDAGMRARVVEIRDHQDDLVEVIFDLTEHTDHNIPLEKPNWYNSAGLPILTAGESGNRPKKHESLYFDLNDSTAYLLLVEENYTHVLDKETHKVIVEALILQKGILAMRIAEALDANDVKNHKDAKDTLIAVNRALKQLRYKEDN